MKNDVEFCEVCCEPLEEFEDLICNYCDENSGFYGLGKYDPIFGEDP